MLQMHVQLKLLVYRVRAQMAAQRCLVATFRAVAAQTKSLLALLPALFDFLYRAARTRCICGAIVAMLAAAQIAEFRDQ